MALTQIIWHWFIVALITLISCNGPSRNDTTAISTQKDPATVIHRVPDIPEEIVYFSHDSGLTWENNSTGLTATTHIGLGGIAASKNKLALLSKDNGLYFYNFQEGKWINIPTYGPLLEGNPGALLFFKGHIYAGTQFGGVFRTGDEGKNWTALNTGLDNLTIRKFAAIEDKLYAATNSGLYSLNEPDSRWEQEYESRSLQVNGIAVLDGKIYIATSQGAFSSPVGQDDWNKIFTNGALHNISSDDQILYAMVYNELFTSRDQGMTWQSIQKGLPAELYTFNVVRIGNDILAAQWDGIYRRDRQHDQWKYSSHGLPANLAISNLMKFNKIVVATGSERRLKTGKTLEKEE